MTEIKDDGGYEWYPDNDLDATIARGIRHLRRAMNSMVLPVLFTHEVYIKNLAIAGWDQVMQEVTNQMNTEYSPEYTTMDYALQYVRAKKNLKLLNVIGNQSSSQIYYQANNDMATKCYYFTEQSGVISYRLIDLPSANGNFIVTVNN